MRAPAAALSPVQIGVALAALGGVFGVAPAGVLFHLPAFHDSLEPVMAIPALVGLTAVPVTVSLAGLAILRHARIRVSGHGVASGLALLFSLAALLGFESAASWFRLQGHVVPADQLAGFHSLLGLARGATALTWFSLVYWRHLEAPVPAFAVAPTASDAVTETDPTRPPA